MVDAPDLDDSWQGLVNDLLSPEYRQSIATLTGLDLSAAGLQITIYQNDPTCWLPPHTDDAPKLVTQTLYFNDHWSPDIGGHLLMLRSNDINDVAARIPPTPSNSVVHMRSPASWHAVLPAKEEGGVMKCRQSMTIAFYDRPEMWANIYGGSPLGSVFPEPE
jgi:Rps23 Pro-64 3,4-dihydroxylase Tpa1-like proline 4-hydroxylase